MLHLILTFYALVYMHFLTFGLCRVFFQLACLSLNAFYVCYFKIFGGNIIIIIIISNLYSPRRQQTFLKTQNKHRQAN